jgi:hypothetical protein
VKPREDDRTRALTASARALLVRGVADRPGRPDHNVLLGRTLCSLGWNRHAVHRYYCALEDDPRSPDALSWRLRANGGPGGVARGGLGRHAFSSMLW